MAEPFVGQIKMFAGNFAPRGWAFCDGQLLAVNQNDALFSLLGTIYGGDGRTTFGLPDLRGRIPVHQGTGPGLSDRRIGSKQGVEAVTLNLNQFPSHSHPAHAANGGDSTSPQNNFWGTDPGGQSGMYSPAQDQTMSPSTLSMAGGSQSHTNLQPTLCISYIIALVGVYPSRH